MKIYIEIIFALILLLFVIFWYIWLKRSERGLLKKYKPENDKGRKGNEPRTTEFGDEKSIGSINGYEQSKRREFLQETSINNDGKDSNSNRKIGFFKR